MLGPFMSLVPFQRPRKPSVLSHSLPAQQPLPTRGINTHGAEERDRTQATKYRINQCVHTSEIKAFFYVTKKKCLKAVLATSQFPPRAVNMFSCWWPLTCHTPPVTSEVTAQAQARFSSQVMSLTAIMCPHFFPGH